MLVVKTETVRTVEFDRINENKVIDSSAIVINVGHYRISFFCND
jgi:hypothetical protein